MDVNELRSLFVFDGLRDDQLAELIAAGEEVDFERGQIMFREGDPAASWWVLLDGRIELLRRGGHEESVVSEIDRPGVWAGGFLAWAETAGYLATGRGASAGRMLRIPADALGALVRSWFPFGVHLITGFFQTVRNLEALSRQREALVALGTLAAGLAHEINNPASAAARSVDALRRTCDTLLGSLVGLADGSLLPEQFLALDGLRREINPSTGNIEPMAVADREESILSWLDAHEVEDGWRLAPVLALAGADLAWCERLSGVLHASTLAPGLEWVASTLSMESLLSEVRDATGRVSALVAAVKSYSQLDRASLQVMDITEGIDSTLTILGHKLGDDITVVRDYAADLPPIEVNAGELNQVWTNLIGNAIDAMGGAGTLRLSTRADGDGVVVEVADTGPGMPLEVQARAFEPFFTTKDVGKGTGLGLDISRRIVVDRHRGHIAIASDPGETVVTVHLPRVHP